MRRPVKEKRFLKKDNILIVVAFVSVLIAVIYVVKTLPPQPRRQVTVEFVVPSGIFYNQTSDELTLRIMLIPSDNNMYLSHITIPNSHPYLEAPINERIYENGTVVKITLAKYSIFMGTPQSGSEVAVIVYVADIDTHEIITKPEIKLKYP